MSNAAAAADVTVSAGTTPDATAPALPPAPAASAAASEVVSPPEKIPTPAREIELAKAFNLNTSKEYDVPNETIAAFEAFKPQDGWYYPGRVPG